MKTEPAKKTKASLLKKIKVRLDYKTIVILKNITFFAKWKRIYPQAKIIR